jgi:PAS domain S-box-containing protein
MKFSVNKMLTAAIVLTLVSVGVVMYVSNKQSEKLKSTSSAVSSTEKVLVHLQKLILSALDNETGARGFVITGNDKSILPIKQSEIDFYNERLTLVKLYSGNPERLHTLDSINLFINKRIDFTQRLVATRKTAGLSSAIEMVNGGEGKRYTEKIRELCLSLETAEASQLSELKQSNDMSMQQLKIILNIILAISLILALAIIFSVWRQFRISEKVKRSLKVLNAQINEAHDSIYIVGVDRKLRSWNKGAQSLYGFTAQEAIGKDSNILLRTEISGEEVEAGIRQVAVTNYWTGELKRKTKTGKDIYVRSTVSTIRNKTGEVTAYVVVSFDITNEKKLTKEISHLVNIVEHSTDAIISRGLDKKIMTWNKGAEELTGYSKEEAIGKTPFQLGIVRFDEQNMVNIDKELIEKSTSKLEANYYHKNGEEFIGRATASVLKDDNGVVIAVAVIIKDITAQRNMEQELIRNNEALEKKILERTEEVRKSEVRFRSLIEHSAEGITLINEKGEVIYRSPSAIRITGNAVLGSADNSVHPDYADEMKNCFIASLDSPEIPISFQSKFKKPEGDYFLGMGTFTNLLHVEGVNAIVTNFRDITEKKEAEDKLSASEERYRNSLDHMMEGVQIIGFDWKYLYINDTVALQGKHSKEELIGNTMMEMYPGIEHTELYKIIGKCMKDREPSHMENEFEYPDKTKGWFQLSIQPAPEGVFILSIDVSERKRSELRIVQSEQNLKAIFENTSEGFVLLNKDATIIACNQVAAKGLPFANDKELAVGDNLFDYIEEIRKPFFGSVLAKALSGEIVQYDKLYHTKEKNILWMNFSYSPVKENKIITGICITGRDITEKKMAEQAREFDSNNLHALINNTKDYIWSIDKQFKLITFNQAFANVFKIATGRIPQKGEFILNHEFPEEELIKYRGYYERALAGESFSSTEFGRLPFAFWSEISFYPIYEGNDVVGTACFSRDITERKMAEEKIRLSNERYVAVAKATSDGIWDHDFVTDKTYVAGTGYKNLFGYNYVNTFIPSNFWEPRVHPGDQQRITKELKEILDDTAKSHASLEYRFLKADGTYAYLNDRFFIIRQNGKAIRMLGAKQDFTEKKKAEEELKTNFFEKRILAERMSNIINTLPANVALLDDTGVIIEINDSWRNFAAGNGFVGNHFGIGDNYVQICDRATGGDKVDGQNVATGIRAVLEKQNKEFIYEYDCHSPIIKRWFRMVVSSLVGTESRGAVVMHIDISELRKLEQDRLERKIEEQKIIAKAMLEAQEKERKSIGVELHDNVNQILVGANMMLAMAKRRPEKAGDMIEVAMKSIYNSINENRRIAHLFVTPDLGNHSLLERLRMLVSNMFETIDIPVKINVENFDEKMMDEERKINIYRIAQEQCTNIIKYANATWVDISLITVNNIFTMEITDNGKGACLDETGGGIGLKNIKGRLSLYNGEAMVTTAPGKGFKLEVSIPINS